jgi:O-antigen/teichoic acid export membrane protein
LALDIEHVKPSWIKRISSPFKVKDKGTQALVITNVLGNVIRLLSNLILARFLSPEAFAITGLASAVVFAFNMVSDGGFRAFILRHKIGGDDRVLNTLWTTKLLRNVILACLLFFFSSHIAAFFDIAELGSVLQVLCLLFIFDGLLPIGFLSIQRENRVSVVMYIQFLCTVLAVIYSVVGVYYYQSYWPIIHSMILKYILQMIVGYIVIGRAGTAFSIDKKIFKEFLAWAKYIIPSSIITLLLMQFDKVILAKSLTITELGLYFVAFNFSSAAAAFAIQYARNVVQPYIAIVYREAPETFKQKYYNKRINISFVIALLLGGLSGASTVFFDVLYDDRYLDAAYYLSILLIMPVMALITYPAEIALILHGELRMTLLANGMRLLWFVCATWIGYVLWGVFGLLLAIGLVELLPAIYMGVKLVRLHLFKPFQEVMIIFSALLGFGISYFCISLFSL